MDDPIEPPAAPPHRPGRRAGRWRRLGVAVIWGLGLTAIFHLPAYLVLRQQHVLFRTAWTRHRSYRGGDDEPWGWRDITVAPHRDLATRHPTTAGVIELVFAPECRAEEWFRARFESCCSFDDEERCDDRPPSWWKWPPHDSWMDEEW